MEDFKLEKYKAELQMWLEQYKLGIESGKNAIRMAFLINSGTSLVLLTFIGTIFTSNKLFASQLFGSLIWFIIGILLLGISSGIVYFNHVAIALNKSKTGLWLEVFTILLVASSYGLFLFGSYEIYKIILTQLSLR
jgi:hypothetical protein